LAYAFQRQILPNLEKQNFCFKKLGNCKLTAGLRNCGVFCNGKILFHEEILSSAERTQSVLIRNCANRPNVGCNCKTNIYQMTTEQNCPNCNSKMSGIFSNNFPLGKSKSDFINKFKGLDDISYCNKCGEKLFYDTKDELSTEKKKLSESIQNLFLSIPVISAQNPLNWNYEIIDMVTGQSVTGTGVIAEFTSTFTDLFGLQSERYNNKIRNGEDLCFAQLRKKTIDLGGNAVLAVDIDYSEIGGDKGMIMVCMTGTAVKLKNIEIFGIERAENIKNLNESLTRFNFLDQWKFTD
jgi:uncharacterized protein YbjQ (UPF0145 family)/DNA-directed RNA polymerase subunit RPC12/RpoP